MRAGAFAALLGLCLWLLYTCWYFRKELWAWIRGRGARRAAGPSAALEMDACMGRARPVAAEESLPARQEAARAEERFALLDADSRARAAEMMREADGFPSSDGMDGPEADPFSGMEGIDAFWEGEDPAADKEEEMTLTKTQE